jgi:hypothetical protein
MSMHKQKQLYDIQKRGTSAPEYSEVEETYRNDVLRRLTNCYETREQSHEELNDMTYSEYYLINRQLDNAYNPPKKNAADSRIVTGIVHEKDTTILSILTSLNFMPKVRVFDTDDREMVDAGAVLTARLKKSLIKEGFKDKMPDYFRMSIAQGNSFVEEKRDVKYYAKKVPTNDTVDSEKKKWKTVVEEKDYGCVSTIIPNTGVYLADLRERNILKQPYIFTVMHVPVDEVARVYKDFSRWENVPKTATEVVPQNEDGRYGDYFLKKPQDDYVEVIVYQSMPKNEFNVFLNGVMMFPVYEDDGVPSGYPLTEVSPSGKYTIVKMDNENIPLFAYAKGVPAKTHVKEETINELMRLMVYKMRQSAKPPIGNNSDRVLQSNVWDPGMITSDLRQEEISPLISNPGIAGADFSFYQLIHNSISESSVSSSVEGTSQQTDVTATQYLDQKRENLKKLGLSIDNAISFLKNLFWLRLYNEIYYMKGEAKKYDADRDEFVDALESFSVDENIDGAQGRLNVAFVEDTSEMNNDEFLMNLMNEEEGEAIPTRTMFVKPSFIKNVMKNLSDRIYIDVVSEPDGQGQQLLGSLFNLLTAYVNLRKGDNSTINFDYIESVIGEHSGFDAHKMFTEAPVEQQEMPQEGAMEGGAGQASPPRDTMIPVNQTRQSPNRVLAD